MIFCVLLRYFPSWSSRPWWKIFFSDFATSVPLYITFLPPPLPRSERLSASSGGISISNISLSSAALLSSEPAPLYKDASSTSEYSSLCSLDRVDGLSLREKVLELETNALKQVNSRLNPVLFLVCDHYCFELSEFLSFMKHKRKRFIRQEHIHLPEFAIFSSWYCFEELINYFWIIDELNL